MKILPSVPTLMQSRALNMCKEMDEMLGKRTKGQFFLWESHCLVGERDEPESGIVAPRGKFQDRCLHRAFQELRGGAG